MKPALGLVALALLAPAATADAQPYANRCVKLGPGRFYVKPASLRSVLLYDGRLLTVGSGASVSRGTAPGKMAEWAMRRSHGRVTVRSAANKRWLKAKGKRLLTTTKPTRLRAKRAHRCKRFPEAGVNAKGKPFKGLKGFADAHLHIAAALRAGGLVISGKNFHRYGAKEALGHDADVHGQDGSLDITGNLLRTGEPTGNHDTNGWPSFTGWPTFDTYTHQQIYYRWLERAWMGGERLVVAQTVEDESICNVEPRKSHPCNETQTIEAEVKQLKALQSYIDAQSGGKGRGWFRLVYGPKAAKRVIERGRLAVLIGMETSNPFGCSEFQDQPQCTKADIDAGIARLRSIGVRSVFIAHWTDNALAGAALEGGDKGQFISALQVSQTGRPFSTGPCPHPEQGEEVLPPAPLPKEFDVSPVTGAAPDALPVARVGEKQCNTRGLTDLGEYAVRKLIDSHMLIEVDHASEWARQKILDIAEERHYPLVSSHTGTGGLWTPDELQRLYALGGFATATVDEADKMPGKLLGFQQYGATGVGIGSDTGGFNALPGPASARYPFKSIRGSVRFGRERTGTRTFDMSKDGMAHYGLVPDWLSIVQRQPRGKAAMRLLFSSAAAYLKMWRTAVGSGA